MDKYWDIDEVDPEIESKGWQKAAHPEVEGFVSNCLRQAGADEPSTAAVTKAIVGASCRGIDSHGIRLLPHYIRVLKGGRVNGAPEMRFTIRSGGTGVLDADNSFGHLAGYRAIEEGIKLAESNGIAAVTVANSSHFGAAGSYTLAAAEAGFISIALCNTDKLVLPHDAVAPFHGTNPFSFAAPVPGEHPYLIDMATSSVPWNRVLQFAPIGRPLPPDVAVDSNGQMTTEARQATALLPLGGESFGYKGAALAGMCEVLSAALTGMAFSNHLCHYGGPDYSTPRHLGHFFIVMKPQAFISKELYDAQIAGYRQELRQQKAKPGTRVLAPGDREWEIQRDRLIHGIVIDSAIWSAFHRLAKELGVPQLKALPI